MLWTYVMELLCAHSWTRNQANIRANENEHWNISFVVKPYKSEGCQNLIFKDFFGDLQRRWFVNKGLFPEAKDTEMCVFVWKTFLMKHETTSDIRGFGLLFAKPHSCKDGTSFLVSTYTAYLTLNTCLSTPRLRYWVPKINTHSWAALPSSTVTLLKPLLRLTRQNMLTDTHYRLTTCALKNSTLSSVCSTSVSECPWLCWWTM